MWLLKYIKRVQSVHVQKGAHSSSLFCFCHDVVFTDPSSAEEKPIESILKHVAGLVMVCYDLGCTSHSVVEIANNSTKCPHIR